MTHRVYPQDKRYYEKTRREGYPRKDRPAGKQKIKRTAYKKMVWQTDEQGRLLPTPRKFITIPKDAIKPGFRSFASDPDVRETERWTVWGRREGKAPMAMPRNRAYIESMEKMYERGEITKEQLEESKKRAR